MFYFEQLLQTALNGIDTANVTSAVLGVAGTHPSPQFSLWRVRSICGRGRRSNACEFGNQVSGPGTGVRQLRRCFSRRQWNVQFRCQFHLQLNGCRGSVRELDEPVGPVLASEWKHVLMESRDWPGFRSHQLNADSERVRHLSRFAISFSLSSTRCTGRYST